MAGTVASNTVDIPVAETLPALREDLSLFDGPRNALGAPSWTLYDPPRNQFFRIGWTEFEIISRWRAGKTAPELARDVTRQTTLSVDGPTVDALLGFLDRNNLLRIAGTRRVRQMRMDKAASRPSFTARLLRSHLFFRLPLIRPAPLLEFLQPVARLFYSKAFLALTCLIGILGTFLAARQWDRFTDTIVALFDWSSFLLIAGTVVVVKILHELGHALTAHRHGCHVPTMGVAFMVLWPVLYTDTTDAWKLTSKRQRLEISGAGIGAELIIAAYATFAWTFLPDGALQTAAFLVATTTWVISILVNLNPFMRFDGYFLFSDLLEVENLQERAFALAKWWLREFLFGFGDPPPETWPRGKRTILLLYAYLTWAYRAILFVGIALLIYHFLFKLAGLLVFFLEIVLLIGLPVSREAKQYTQRAGDLSLNRQTVTTAILIAALAAGVATPWASSVTVPSLLRPTAHTVIYAPVTARIVALAVKQGARVSAGTPLVTLRSQDLDNAIDIARAQVAVLERRLAFERFDPAQRQNRLVVDSKLQAAHARLTGLSRERAELSIAAPIGGTVVEIPEDTRSGDWVAEGEPMLMIAESSQAVIEAYIPEGTVKRVDIGASVKFYPENLDDRPLTGIVESIDPTAVTVIDSAYLASTFGGGIAVNETDTGKLIPQSSHYRARISIKGTERSLMRIARGNAVISAENISLAEKAWKSMLGVFVRESGF